MRPSVALNLYRDRIREIALSHHVTNPRVFGSVLRGDDTDDSDLGIVVEPTAETTLIDIGAIQFELSELLQISIDVLTPRALPEKWRETILLEAQPV
jgi:predicted nucleotidyltransferase